MGECDSMMEEVYGGWTRVEEIWRLGREAQQAWQRRVSKQGRNGSWVSGDARNAILIGLVLIDFFLHLNLASLFDFPFLPQAARRHCNFTNSHWLFPRDAISPFTAVLTRQFHALIGEELRHHVKFGYG